MNSLKRLSGVFVVAALLLSIGGSYTARAVTAADWRAGRIIDDGAFTDANAMSVAQIQSFLNSKVPNCDTWGTQASEFGGGTRAQYGASHGNPAPFTCLKDYYEVPKTSPGPGEPASNYGGAAIPPGARSAAQIISDAAIKYNISPKVLLVKLATESPGPLTTDDWPFKRQYLYAMGAHCPDSGPGGAANCDANWASFSLQMDEAASLMRWYLDSMRQPWWQYKKPYQVNNILWNVTERGCGGANVYIETMATAALYTYTPYQPNQAALNNMYSTGDNCSAYGNRNFWRVFNDWFGSTIGGAPVSTELRLTTPLTLSPQIPVPGKPTAVSFTVKNYSSSAVSYQNTLVQCRLDGSTNCDSPWEPAATIQPGESKSFSTTITIPQGGGYTFSPYFLATNGTWFRFGSDIAGGYTTTLEIPDLRLTGPITLNPENASIGQPTTVHLNVVNYGTKPVSLDTSVIQCRFDAGSSCDSNYGGAITLRRGDRMTFSYSYTPQAESQTLIPYYRVNGVWYKYNPDSLNSKVVTIPNVRLTSPIALSPTQPIPGEPTTITYTVKNFGSQAVTYQDSVLQCRMNGYANCDITPTPSAPLTLSPGESRTLTANFTAWNPGSYRFVPYFRYNDTWYTYAGDSFATSSSLNVEAYSADLRLTENIDISPAQPVPGQDITVTYTVKNFGTKAAYFQDGLLQCRLNSSTNCDGPYLGKIVLQPGETRQFTFTTQALSGSYRFTPYFLQSDTWRTYQQGAANASSASLQVAPYSPDLRLISPISLSPSSPTANQSTTATFTVKNFGTKPVYYQTAVLQCRVNGMVCDSSYDAPLVIQPDESRTFTQSFTAKSGQHTLIPYYLHDNTWRQYSRGAQASNTLLFVN